MISLFGIVPKKMKTLIWKDTWIPIFIAELFTTVKIWKQPKCPSTDEDVLNAHTHTHMQAHNEVLLNH